MFRCCKFTGLAVMFASTSELLSTDLVAGSLASLLILLHHSKFGGKSQIYCYVFKSGYLVDGVTQMSTFGALVGFIYFEYFGWYMTGRES